MNTSKGTDTVTLPGDDEVGTFRVAMTEEGQLGVFLAVETEQQTTYDTVCLFAEMLADVIGHLTKHMVCEAGVLNEMLFNCTADVIHEKWKAKTEKRKDPFPF